jgi:hypothetical protein
LTGANLRDANLSHANLEGSGLSHANLARARLRDAKLERANLRSAFLWDADLQAAVLREANLEQADLRYANLEGANLEGASLGGADVDDTTVMPEGWEEIVASKPEDEPPSHRADEEASSATGARDTALRSTMKLCINCCTLTADDVLLCAECGMSLIKVPTGEEAVELRKAYQADHPEETRLLDTTDRKGPGALQVAKFIWGWVLLGVGLAAMVCAAGASLGPVIMLAGTLYSGFGIWMIWSGGRRLAAPDDRTRALLWAGGPLAAGASAVAWLGGALLAGVFLSRIGDLVGLGVWPSLVFGGTVALLFLGGLFVAPLVGASIVLVEWLRRRSKSSEMRPGSE